MTKATAKSFIVEYRHEGQDYTFPIKAEDLSDAQRRLNKAKKRGGPLIVPGRYGVMAKTADGEEYAEAGEDYVIPYDYQGTSYALSFHANSQKDARERVKSIKKTAQIKDPYKVME